MGSTTDLPVAVGDVIAGKYRVDRVLGKGGMGVVLAATHLELGEVRAIKLLLPEVLDSEDLVKRFLREARVVARLKSRHVVQVFDVGRRDDGSPYIVMEYLQGGDVEELMNGQPFLDVGTVVNIVLQSMEAIAEAHAAGIVHRDIKPANLFLTEDLDGSCVKVLDFGISKFAESDTAMSLTATNAVMGTPFYMSPEQMMSAKEVDHRTDIWSLGVVLYELLSRKLPFKGANVGEQCKLLLTTEPPSLAALVPQPLPAGLEEAVMGFLARELPDRHADVVVAARTILPFATDPDADRIMRRIERALAAGPRSAPMSLADISGRFSLPGPATGSGPTGTISQPAMEDSLAATVATDPELATITLDGDEAAEALTKSTKATWQRTADRPAARSRGPVVAAALAGLVLLGGLGLAMTRGDAEAEDSPAAAGETSGEGSAEATDQVQDEPSAEADEPTTEPSGQPTTEPSGQPTTEPDSQPSVEATTDEPEPASPPKTVEPKPVDKAKPPAPMPVAAPPPPPKAPPPPKPSPEPTKDPFGTGRH